MLIIIYVCAKTWHYRPGRVHITGFHFAGSVAPKPLLTP